MFLYNCISCLICDSPSLTMTTSIPSSARCVFITIHSATVLHFEASQKCRGKLLVVVFALLSVRKQTSALTAQIAPSPQCNHYSLLAGSSFLFLTESWPYASSLVRALSRSRSAVDSLQIGASQVGSARIRTRPSSFSSKSAKQTHFTLTVNKTPSLQTIESGSIFLIFGRR